MLDTMLVALLDSVAATLTTGGYVHAHATATGTGFTPGPYVFVLGEVGAPVVAVGHYPPTDPVPLPIYRALLLAAGYSVAASCDAFDEPLLLVRDPVAAWPEGEGSA